MLSMQAFYDQLFLKKDEQREYFQNLVQLTRISLSQAEVIKTNITWTIWHASSQ